MAVDAMIEDEVRPAPDGAVDQRAFRGALGLFATGVTVITARHATAGLVGITANSFNSVSLDPPLVLFSIAKSARSLPALLESSSFAVNVLRRDQTDLSSRFARASSDKWTGVAYAPGRFGAPILAGTMAAFDCVRYAAYEGGDHSIIVGRVVAMEHDAQGEPLLYYRGAYHAIGETLA